MRASGFLPRGGGQARSLVLALAAGCLLAAAARAGADLKSGRAALLRGEWAEAEKQLKAAPAAEKPAATLALGEVYLATGRYEEALQQGRAAAAIPATKSAGFCLAGEALRETGKSPEAIAAFQSALAADGRNLRARVYLGITLLESGKKTEAEKPLDLFFQEFNAGKIDGAPALTYTAMAARFLEAWQDASDAFQSAVEKDPEFLLANLEWGDLFLLKYRADEAQKCYQAVLKINPRHPRALVGLAAARIEAAYDVEGARKLAASALESNPRFVPALNLQARLALDDEQFAPAEALLRRSLAVNPNAVEALALLGASRYLQDDLSGYEAQRQKALKQNPRAAAFYNIVADLAARHHRYDEAAALAREALKADPDDADALAGLGINLLRRGAPAEAEALKVLDRAFQRDGFNVRTFNTLNLYEEVIAKAYETLPAGPFLFRLSRKEKPLLARYVPASMQEAWRRYVEKYGFTPKSPVTVELFTERQHYGARTTGLPEIGAQGTCFGELITAMSPASAEASWEEVLWHELAHVFHLQLSRGRVPRWFTEGLAEYETNVARPYWKREHGREIYLSLRRGDLWTFSELSAAFTHPDRPNGVVIAYHQSSLAIHYLVESAGFTRIVEALKLYSQGKRDAEVLPAITGKPVAQLDSGFREWLRKRYACYENAFLFDTSGLADLPALKGTAEASPADALAQARYAAALLEKEPAMAAERARTALTLPGASDAALTLARYVLGRALLETEKPVEAKKELETLLAAGTDGPDIRAALARIAAAGGDFEAAKTHAGRAMQLDPDDTDPHVLLMQLYEAKGLRAELAQAMERYLDLEEHDHGTARLLIDRLAADEKWADVVRVAPRVIGITPMEPFVQQQYGTALAKLDRPKEAIPELEAALEAGVRRPGRIRGLLAAQHLKAGDRARARAAAMQALQEEPENPDARTVLQATE